MEAERASEFDVISLGPCRRPSPIAEEARSFGSRVFGRDPGRVLVDDIVPARGARPRGLGAFELAGPRDPIYFDPAALRAGVVTCGGLCPGINDVVRGLVMVLWHRYGVRSIEGYRYGYEGLAPSYRHEPLALVPEAVTRIHEAGGTLLGSSRGPQDPEVMARYLDARGVRLLFVIGGDGTMRGALALSQAARARGQELSVVGVPKTIDNDIPIIDESFGFESAFAKGEEAIRGAHVEATGARCGVGLVKLMGRHSGFIAAHAALANNDVNFVLVPEVSFPLDGGDGFLSILHQRLERRGHAVVVAAEGAGQHLLDGEARSHDASGNVRLGDIGLFLRDRVAAYMDARGIDVTIKYFDPSYSLRSIPASAYDSFYCFRLAASAVHAGMAGRTEVVVGKYHERIAHLPMRLVVAGRKRIDPAGELWLSVLEATGQPAWGARPAPATSAASAPR
jgi:6-phosphofructokinase 1